MGNLKLRIDFSFIILAAVCIAFRQSYLFAMYIISVLIHELAHLLVARRLRYECCYIKLSVFGAVLYGSFDSLDSPDEIKIAIAGPIVNLILVVVLVAFWWILPDSYHFTHLAVTANLSLAVVNLLPCYPLDGGRILIAWLSNRMENKKAVNLTKILAFCLACLTFLVFLLSVVLLQPNFSIGAFAIFMLSSAIGNNENMLYRRLLMLNNYTNKLYKGIEIKHFVFSSDVMLFQLLKKLSANYYAIFVVFDGQKELFSISQNQLEKILTINQTNTILADLVF